MYAKYKKQISTKLLTKVINPFIISTIKFKNVTNNDCEGKKIRTLDLQRVGVCCEPMVQA